MNRFKRLVRRWHRRWDWLFIPPKFKACLTAMGLDPKTLEAQEDTAMKSERKVKK